MNSHGQARERLRVGVVGCGVIAQVMHLTHVRALADRYELAAVCDVSTDLAEACARRYGAEQSYTSYEDMLLRADLDVVLDLTPDSHAPLALAAVQAGCHVFVEKPMCFGLGEGREVFEAVSAAGVTFMVGTHKRYDPAYERLLQALPGTTVPLVQSTTLESPFEPYVEHYGLLRGAAPAGVIERLRAEHRARLEAELPGADEETLHCYRYMLLCNLIHELNMLRGALGEPDLVRYANVGREVTYIGMRFGQTECHLSWVNLPGMARYSQKLAFFGLERRLTLELPSPYLRDMPSLLVTETGEEGSTHSQRGVEVVSYEEAFKCELIELADAIEERRDPRTNILDGLHDVALCSSIIRSHMTGRPVENPSELPAWANRHAAEV
jgi:predicted dehydrogenase